MKSPQARLSICAPPADAVVKARLRRRSAIAAILGAAFAARGVAAQQTPARIRRVAILSPGTTETRPIFVAFRTRLRELGYVEGRDVALVFHLAHGNDRLPAMAQEILRQGADVVVTDGPFASIAMHAAGCGIPIVAIFGGDPVALGFAKSIARPGGCMTGVTTISDVLDPKPLEFLREIVPAARRIGVVSAGTREGLRRALEERAATLGFTLRYILVRIPEEAARELAPSALADIDGLIVTSGPINAGLSAVVAPLINAARKPAIYSDRDYVSAGGLAVYGSDIVDLYRQLAASVDRILKGANPGDLPFELPTRIELVVNLKTAQAIGLSLPQSIVARADEVIE